MNILVIQQKMIGDVLTSTILCENLKREFPHCRIDYVANDNTLAVIEANPYIDKVIVFKKEYKKSKRALFRFLRTFKNTDYDILIDAYGKTESNLISWFTPAKTKISYYKWYTHFLYTHALKRYTTATATGLAIKNRLLLLQPLIKDAAALVSKPRIYLTKDEISAAKTFLESHHINLHQPIIMLGVLGSSPSKTYPLPYMAAIIDTIAQTTEATLLFNYIPAQEAEAKALYMLCSETTRSRIKFDVFASSLRDFLAVLYHCNALIGNEGGAVNMAKALDIPTFSIFSPWIAKEAWDLFGDEKNMAVHIKDFKPELLEGKSSKELRKNVVTLYEVCKPSYFEDHLNRFLTRIIQ